MPQHDPRLVQHEQAGLACKAVFNTVEQIEQHRNQVDLAHLHECFDLKDSEAGQGQSVFLGVQQVPHCACPGVMPERLLHLIVLQCVPEIGERAHFARVVRQGLQCQMDSVPVFGQYLQILQLGQARDPFRRKGELLVRGVDILERCKGQVATANIVVITANRLGQRVHGQPLVEYVHGRPGVAAELGCNQRQQGRFARTCGAQNQGMAQIALMQVEAERRRTIRGQHGEAARIGRVVGAGIERQARPHRRQGQQIGQVERVDERTAQVGIGIAGN